MTSFSHRRRRNITLTAIAAVVIGLVVYSLEAELLRSAFVTGWMLLVLMVFLTIYNARKKLPFLPLGSSAVWLQLHIYAGLLTVAIFPMHAGFHLPNGVLESFLALLFVLVAGSGILGAILSRTIPQWLSVRGEEVIFERIPAFRAQVRDEAHRLALESVAAANATTIADYYARRLARFFGKPRHFWHHVTQSTRPRHAILSELRGLDRYLSPDERPYAEKITALVCRKDDLDYHHALQGVMKGWLFMHVGLTYSLILLAVAHAVLVYAFAGGAR